jgi:heptosyltransferase-3
MALLALFPGALGDLLCCWPALQALRRATGAALTLAAHDAWFDALPADAVTPLSIHRREIADLFGSDPLHESTRSLLGGFARVESWTGHGDDAFAQRLAAASGGPAAVHPFRAFGAGEHASEYYARCVGVVPIAERLPVRAAAAAWAETRWRQHRLGPRTVVIHAGSGSIRKNWEGLAEVAAAWRASGGQVVSLCGPAESERGAGLPHDLEVRGERLDRIAALLARASCYLGNDSGISHLAGLVGVPTIALFGPSDPHTWRPLGDSVSVLHAPDPCRRCGPGRFCTHRLAVGAVLEALTTA